MSDTDTATTAPTAAKRARTCYYTTDNNRTIVRRLSGAPDKLFDPNAVPPEAFFRAGVEGIIHQLIAGKTDADIYAGTAFPDRSLPVPKEQRAKRVAAAREPGPWIKAIAQVKAKDLIKAARSGGQKVGPSEAEAHNATGLTWALSLNKEQDRALRKHKLVRMAHAEITGEGGSLDDVLTPLMPQTAGASQSLEEAAD